MDNCCPALILPLLLALGGCEGDVDTAGPVLGDPGYTSLEGQTCGEADVLLVGTCRDEALEADSAIEDRLGPGTS
jgi:hypothetical protein